MRVAEEKTAALPSCQGPRIWKRGRISSAWDLASLLLVWSFLYDDPLTEVCRSPGEVIVVLLSCCLGH